MNTVASLPAKWRKDAERFGGDRGLVFDLCAMELKAALATPAVEGAISAGEAVAFPEVLEGDGGLYVRRERAEGFSAEACRRLNELRLSAMRSGEHITTEDAVSFARSVLSEFTPPPAPAAEPLGEALRKAYEPDEYEDAFKGRTQPEARGVEEIAKALWHRFGDDSRMAWEDEHEKAIYRDAAAQVIALATTPNPVRAEQPSKSPSYDALLIIAQSVCGALGRAGLTDCDDPGEAIDVMRERYEKRLTEQTNWLAVANALKVEAETWVGRNPEFADGYETAIRRAEQIARQFTVEQPEGKGANISPLVVTRGDGVPLQDQAAALAEFKRQCAAPAAPVGVEGVPGFSMDDMALCEAGVWSLQESDSHVQECQAVAISKLIQFVYAALAGKDGA